MLGSRKQKIGALQLNIFRMLLTPLLSATLWIFTGTPLSLYADSKTWLWLTMSGVVYDLGDYCLLNFYILSNSPFRQLFMTLALITAGISSCLILGERLFVQAVTVMIVTVLNLRFWLI